jgi:hypothetical protein
MILDFLIFAPSISSSKAWRDLVAASQLIDLIDNYIDSLSCGKTGAGERGGGPSETIYRYRIGAVPRSRASAGGSRVEFRASSGDKREDAEPSARLVRRRRRTGCGFRFSEAFHERHGHDDSDKD